MTLELVRPAFLLLLLGIPISWALLRAARRGPLATSDRTALVLRSILIALLSVVLAEPRQVTRAESRATAIVLDVSESVPEDARRAGEKWIKDSLLDRDVAKDDVSFLVFAQNTGIEVPFRGTGGLETSDLRPLDPTRVGTILDRSETDLAAAVNAALASFPPEAARRTLLLTDGNETRGNVREAARAMLAAGIELQVLPLQYRRRHEILVEKVVAPPRAAAGRPIKVNAVVVSTEDDVPATLRFSDGEGNTLITEETVLKAGRNAFEISRTLPFHGLHRVVLDVTSPGDGNIANNRGSAATHAEGRPAILVVSGKDGESDAIMAALSRAELYPVEIFASQFPKDPGSLLPYGAVVLANCPASAFSPEQLLMLKSVVQESGLGLVCIGGPDTYAAGGYGGTPLEEILPVTMDVTQKRVLPNGALCVVLHTCEFPQGNDWGRTITKKAIQSLGRNDLFGCVAWEGTVKWVVPLGKGDKSAMIAAVDRSNAMDMPSLQDCVKAAVDGLEGARAYLKHMIIISDGDPAMPDAALVQRCIDARISITAVAIAQHGPQDAMLPMTAATGGRYYALDPGQVNLLPGIFMKEAAIVRRSAVSEEPFAPTPGSFSEILRGVDLATAPNLQGYVVTTARERAEVLILGPEADPILALWRTGLARTAAFTSDLSGRWGRDWLAWPHFDRFTSQLLRACLRGLSDSPFSATIEAHGGAGTLVVEAIDEQGNSVDGLEFEGRILVPDGESETVRPVQTAPGRYEARFAARKPGLYLAVLEHDVPASGGATARAQIRAPLSVDYSAEHLHMASDDRLFRDLESMGARILGYADRPFAEPVPEASTALDIWRWFLVAAVLFLPLEIAARRLRLDPGPMLATLVARLRRQPPARRSADATGDDPEPSTSGPSATAGSAGAAAARTAAEAALRPKPSPGEEKPGTAGNTPPVGDAGTQDLLKAKKRARKRSTWEEN